MGEAITNNTAVSEGGGLYVNIRSKAVLKDGAEISENTTTHAGGGADLFHRSTFTMQSGRIADNTAGGPVGGGIYIRNDVKLFTMVEVRYTEAITRKKRTPPLLPTAAMLFMTGEHHRPLFESLV
jgi:hypothetical protein